MRNVFRFLFGNWFARAYLLLVAVAAVLVFVVSMSEARTPISPAFWLILVTLPGSLLMPSPVAALASGRLGDVIFFCAWRSVR